MILKKSLRFITAIIIKIVILRGSGAQKCLKILGVIFRIQKKKMILFIIFQMTQSLCFYLTWIARYDLFLKFAYFSKGIHVDALQ